MGLQACAYLLNWSSVIFWDKEAFWANQRKYVWANVGLNFVAIVIYLLTGDSFWDIITSVD